MIVAVPPMNPVIVEWDKKSTKIPSLHQCNTKTLQTHRTKRSNNNNQNDKAKRKKVKTSNDNANVSQTFLVGWLTLENLKLFERFQ